MDKKDYEVRTAPGDAYNPTALAVHTVAWKHRHRHQHINNLLPPNSGWQLLSACSISDIGSITGIRFFQQPGQNPELLVPAAVLDAN